jgi:lysozyme family protein
VAKFEEAYEKTMGYEGGYVFDPKDRGGETYKGIARRSHPSWEGWPFIDRVKKGKDWQKNYGPDLEGLVQKFYRAYYWDRVLGDHIPSQAVANELFDTAVNLGVERAGTFLQKSLNALNRNQDRRLYPDLVEDGMAGKKTLDALTMYLTVDSVAFLLTLMNVFQGHHYTEVMRKSPDQEKFARGWLSRVVLTKA